MTGRPRLSRPRQPKCEHISVRAETHALLKLEAERRGVTIKQLLERLLAETGIQ